MGGRSRCSGMGVEEIGGRTGTPRPNRLCTVGMLVGPLAAEVNLRDKTPKLQILQYITYVHTYLGGPSVEVPAVRETLIPLGGMGGEGVGVCLAEGLGGTGGTPRRHNSRRVLHILTVTSQLVAR